MIPVTYTFAWLDLEMTGLNPDTDTILEIATALTDESLEHILEGPSLAIHCPAAKLHQMDDWNTQTHSRSGLVNKCLTSDVSIANAEHQVLSFLQKYLKHKQSPLCGRSNVMDLRFLRRYMPNLANFFHYRMLDVASVKYFMNLATPLSHINTGKRDNHRAMDDVIDAINELRIYRDIVTDATSENYKRV